jgi:hypothetical protein
MEKQEISKTVYIAVFLCLLILGSVSTTASAAQYEFDEPTVSAYIDGNNMIESGETKMFDVHVVNQGDKIINSDNNIAKLRSASNTYNIKPGDIQGVQVNFKTQDSTFKQDKHRFNIKSDTLSLDEISAGESSGHQVKIESAEDLKAGTYKIPIEVQYTYIYRIYTGQDNHIINKNTETIEKNIEITVEKSANLEISGVESTGLYENSEGNINVQLKNTGTENARDATIRMMSTQDIKPTTNLVNLGELDSGETVEADFQVLIDEGVSEGNYSVGFNMRYEGNNGDTKTTNTEYASVEIKKGPDFNVNIKESKLYVDSVGRIELSVENTGDSTMDKARINLQPHEALTTVSSSSWIGSIEPGESKSTSFKLEVSSRAVSKEYPLDFIMKYDDDNGNRIRSKILTGEAEVGIEKSFDIINKAKISAGTTDTVEYVIKNTGSSTLRGATVRVNSNSPFETDDDTTYVGTLRPGDKDTVRYKMTVESSATVDKSYSLDSTIKFKNTFDNTVTTDTVSAPIEVVSNDGLPLIPIIGGVGILLGIMIPVSIYKLR